MGEACATNTLKHLMVLALLANGPVQGRTRMMKLLFLAQKGVEKRGLNLGEEGFDFIPYRFGPWSYEVLMILEDLQKEGLVEEIVEEAPRYGPRFRYILTRRGQEEAEKADEYTPTLIIHGTKDLAIPIETAEKLCDELPDCRGMVPVPGAPHASNMTHPNVVNPTIKDFLARLD